MADFKTHTLVGSGLGLALSYAAFARDWATQFPILVLIYVATIIGSYLPDLDHDSGRPVRIVFTFFGIIGAIITLLLCIFRFDISWLGIMVWTGTIYLIIRYFISYFFKKFTKHRGIYHSVPMMLIAFLLTFSLVNLFDISKETKVVISLGVAFGFLSHLVLDEIFSTKTFLGIPYKMNSSFGSSLKFASKSKWSTILMYILLFCLIYLHKDLIPSLLR